MQRRKTTAKQCKAHSYILIIILGCKTRPGYPITPDKADARNQDLEGTAEIQPELTNTEAWNVWKEMMIAVQPDMKEHGKQLALYMHCMIQ